MISHSLIYPRVPRVARVALSEQGSRQYAFEPVHECLLLDKDNLTKITLIPDQPEHLETITHIRYQHATHGSFPLLSFPPIRSVTKSV